MEVWKRSVSYSLLALYFGAFMEWLFYVTKPSFLSLLSFPEALLILFIAPLPWAALILLGLSLLLLLQRAASRRLPNLFGVAYALVPALFLASAFFLMIDRFTYTVFGFGVVNTRGGWRVLYGVLFVALLGYTARACFAKLQAAVPASRSWMSVATGILTVSVLCLILALSSRSTIQRDD